MDARARYDEICDDLLAQNPDVTLGQMMGMPCIKRGGKMVGGFWKVFHPLRRSRPRSGPVEVVRGNREVPSPKRRAPMREWVVVPALR